MLTVSEHGEQRRQENGTRTKTKEKNKKKSMAKENEKDFLPKKELPFPFEKELFQNQVKNTPAVIKEFIPLNDSDNCKVIVFSQESGLFVGWLVLRALFPFVPPILLNE